MTDSSESTPGGPADPATRRSVGAVHVLIAMVLIAGIYIAIQAILPHSTFFSNDGGEKLALVKALVKNRGFDLSIPYDWLGVEPKGSLHFVPFPAGYAFVREGRLYSIVPFYFPMASTPFYSLFGPAGLFILPMLGSLLTTGLVAYLCARSMGHAAALMGAVAIGLASSVFFYGLTFWEHTVSMALAAAALALWYRSRDHASRFSFAQFAAGVLIGIGGWMRADVFFLGAGLGLATLTRRGHRREILPLSLGLLTSLVPFVLLNFAAYGMPLGPQVHLGVGILSGSGSLADLLQARWTVTRYLLLAYAHRPWFDALAFAFATIPAIYFGRLRRWTPRNEIGLLAWIALLSASLLATLALLISTPDLIRETMNLVGLMVALPVIPLALARPRHSEPRGDDDFYTALARAVSVALLISCVALADPGGLQWGPRYALALFPPLTLLAVRGTLDLYAKLSRASFRRSFVLLVALLLASGASIQMLGADLLATKTRITAQNNQAIRAAQPQAIVTDVWWFPMDSGDLLDEIPFYGLPMGEGASRLLEGLERAGVERVLIVTTSDIRPALASTARLEQIGFQRLHHPKAPTFDLVLHSVRLITPPGQH